jgi:hypothetical protein
MVQPRRHPASDAVAIGGLVARFSSALRKAMSKPALCATSGASPTKARNWSAIWANSGLSRRHGSGCTGILGGRQRHNQDGEDLPLWCRHGAADQEGSTMKAEAGRDCGCDSRARVAGLWTIREQRQSLSVVDATRSTNEANNYNIQELSDPLSEFPVIV